MTEAPETFLLAGNHSPLLCLFCYNGPSRISQIMSVHIWLRAETKPNEQRCALTPQKCQVLIEKGEP